MKGNRKSNSKNPSDWQRFDFVEIRVGEQEKKDFHAKLTKDPNHFLGEVDNLTKNGYKVSLSYDTNNSCIIASLTCKEPNDPNFNNVLTARASEVWEALSLVMYKHMYMCDDGDWGGDTVQDGRQWG